MIAFALNGEQLPLLNGFPLRLIVPGWCSTYWVKMLSDIEVLDKADRIRLYGGHPLGSGETGRRMFGGRLARQLASVPSCTTGNARRECTKLQPVRPAETVARFCQTVPWKIHAG
jgi:DMSO/TMAO reductase YedYZ molybdopterin-dependent catalytic subunit